MLYALFLISCCQILYSCDVSCLKCAVYMNERRDENHDDDQESYSGWWGGLRTWDEGMRGRHLISSFLEGIMMIISYVHGMNGRKLLNVWWWLMFMIICITLMLHHPPLKTMMMVMIMWISSWNLTRCQMCDPNARILIWHLLLSSPSFFQNRQEHF